MVLCNRRSSASQRSGFMAYLLVWSFRKVSVEWAAEKVWKWEEQQRRQRLEPGGLAAPSLVPEEESKASQNLEISRPSSQCWP